MTTHDDFLVEIHTEELPPKAILKMADAFCQQIQERLEKAALTFQSIRHFATPRRLAVYVTGLASAQPDQVVERKGPALAAAFDAEGKPSQACIGFARSCGVTPADLKTIETPQGAWVGYLQSVSGKPVCELMPAIVEQAATALPIPKRMRWGDNDAQFTRPIHSVIMLYGADVVEGKILGYPADRKTRGHRFHSKDWLSISTAKEYAKQLREAYVVADFAERRALIKDEAEKAVREQIDQNAIAQIDESLLDEVTGLVEWPNAIVGHFDEAFLAVPPEVLISSMQDHQRYFPVVNADKKLLPHFVTISNIMSQEPSRVAHGNERVLRARLSDAAFFFETDKKETLSSRLESLKGIVFQAKLGTLYEKVERISRLAGIIAKSLEVNEAAAKQAGLLSKTDLTTNMVGEFPELQGTMGFYYAQHDGLPTDVAIAMKEHYMPRFAGDALPANPVGQVVAIADRLDTLIGAFGINQIPTGDKDPYGLRRAAVGLIRILIENRLNLDLADALNAAVDGYTVSLENKEAAQQVLSFIQERLRAWYQEQGIMPDVFAAVAALNITNPLNIHARVQAVQAFKKLAEAEALSVANKRVSNILAKYHENLDSATINPAIFEVAAEQVLARELEAKRQIVEKLSQSAQYDEVLVQLAGLRKPVDDFFDQVMVMTEDKPRRENRILLLSQLRALFLHVADIALLQ